MVADTPAPYLLVLVLVQQDVVEVTEEGRQTWRHAGLGHPVEVEGGQAAVDAPHTQVLAGARGEDAEGLRREGLGEGGKVRREGEREGGREGREEGGREGEEMNFFSDDLPQK